MASLTRGEILQALQNVGRINTFIDTTKANRWFNEFDTKMARLKARLAPLRVATSTTYSVSNTSDSHALPDGLDEFKASELGFFVLDNKGKKDYKLYYTSEGSYVEGYYIEGDTIYFTGFGNSTKTVKLLYIPKYTRKLVYDETDELEVDDEFSELAFYFIAYKYFEDEEELENKIEYLGQFQEFLNDFEEDYKRDIKKGFETPNILYAFG
jgi:hypothetical protein